MPSGKRIDAGFADVLKDITGNSGCAVCASGNGPSEERSRALLRHPGNDEERIRR